MKLLFIRGQLPILLAASTLIVFLFSFSFHNDPIERIIEGYSKYLKEMPEEKVSLHQDRNTYASGETIWFKTYLTAGPYHLPSSLSRTVYVELIDFENRLVKSDKIFSPNGFAAGHFDLPYDLPTGNYLLRAYTLWMKNFGEAYFFQRQITIYSVDSKPVEHALSEGQPDLQFFPEGGQLIEGVFSKVGFKCIGTDGLGMKVRGRIFDQNREVGTFESNQLGMGYFGLLPEKGKQYTAKIEGIEQQFQLPVPVSSGLVMAVTHSPDSDELLIKFVASKDAVHKTVFLLAQSRGVVCASAKADLSQKVAFVKIPKREFPSGIASLTTMDEAGNPLAERLVFIDHQDELQVSISSDKKSYQPREMIRLEIEARTNKGDPAIGNFSLRVVDAGQLEEGDNRMSIRAHLLLTSELKGNVESPGYYFNKENTDRAEALDYLMLTQGWRKFTVKQALSGQLPPLNYHLEQGITLQGQLKNSRTNQPEPNGTVSFLSLYPVVSSLTVSTDAKGLFELRDLVFFDSLQVILEGKAKNKRAAVKINLFSKSDSINVPLWNSKLIEKHDYLENFRFEAIQRREISRAFNRDTSEILLESVEVKARKIDVPLGGPRIYGEGTVSLQVAGNVALENLMHPLDLLRGRIAGVQVSGPVENPSVSIQGFGSINGSSTPLIMIDDIPVDIKFLYTLPVLEIERVAVWKGADTAVFGSRGSNGAINFYTKRGKRADPNTPSQASRQSNPLGITGYQIEKEFYAPKYHPEALSSPAPDRRITIHWEPLIQTDSLGRATVTFYNADPETNIMAEIEGLSENGIPGKTHFHYQVYRR